MRSRTWTGRSCLALLLAAGSAGAIWPARRAAAQSHSHEGSSSAHLSGGNSLAGRNMFPGASATFYRGHNRYPTIGGGYLPYYGTYSLGVPYSPYYYGTYGFAPLFVPADSLFGPGPLMQNIGNLVPADDGGNLPRLPRNLPAPKQQAGQQAGQAQQAAQGAGVANPPAQKKVRVTNAASKARAGKFLQSGDTQFGKQKFHQALERYREGALSAPDLGDCYFRQAFAQVAMGQYDAASKAIQRGLRLQPNWADSAFTLDSLYGAGHHLEKLSHREGLAQAIEQNPLDAGLYLAMGALLYFDGEHERSRPFFERAAQIGGNDDHLLDGFLAPMPADAGNDAAGKNAADRDAAAKGAADKAAARPAGKVNL